MRKLLLLFFISCILDAGNAYSQKGREDWRNDEYEVQFIRTGVEGTILFKIYSYGKNEKECLEKAKRNAIRAVLFSGIPGSDLQRPMVPEAGAEDLYLDYFNAFFRKSGKYLNYVSISTDGSIDSNDRMKVGRKVKVGIAVAVQKSSLRKELESAGVIKKLGDGF